MISIDLIGVDFRKMFSIRLSASEEELIDIIFPFGLLQMTSLKGPYNYIVSSGCSYLAKTKCIVQRKNSIGIEVFRDVIVSKLMCILVWRNCIMYLGAFKQKKMEKILQCRRRNTKKVQKKGKKVS
uniref:Uncharacterized protein n=1 Tax=Cacopsylla melanoneura TaxID=428564 RepID=A0A8D8ZFB5_9HEMI